MAPRGLPGEARPLSSSATTGPRLRAWRGEEWIGEWPLLPGRTLRFGRGRDADVVLDDPGVSRRHLEIRPLADGWEAVDLGSSGGTFCNGERIAGRRLRSGDQLTLGSTGLLVLDLAPETLAPPPPPPPFAAAPGRRMRRAAWRRGPVLLVAAVAAIVTLAVGAALVVRLGRDAPWRRWFPPERTGFAADATRVGVEGGVVEVGGARVTIPAGALVREEKVELRPAGAVPTLTYAPAGPAFTLRTEQVTFAKPLTVTLPLDRSALPPDVTPDRVHVVLAQHGLGERLEGARVDLAAGTVSVPLPYAAPLVSPQGTPGAATPPVLQAAVGPALGVVLSTPQAIYVAPEGLRDARRRAEEARVVLHLVQGLYAPFEIERAPLRIGFEKMAETIGAYVSGRYEITINYEHWDAVPSGRVSTLAHEYFHLLQNRYVARNLSPHGHLVPNDYAARGQAEWLWEATATWMDTHLVPTGNPRNAWRLTRNFPYRPLNLFEAASVAPGAVNPDNPHQYSAFVFFSYLDTLYVGRNVVLAAWNDYVSGSWQRTDVEHDAWQGRGTFNPLEVLDHRLQATPDRNGRRRGLREVYADFLLHFAWYKDFPPLADPAIRTGQQLGEPRELVLPGKVVAWTLPFVENGEVATRRSDRASGGPYAIVRAYHLTNPLDRATAPESDLEVRLAIPRSRPPEESMIVLFPFRRGAMAPLVGNARSPILLEDWHTYLGAVVWSVDLSLFGEADLTTTVELKHPHERPANQPSFAMTASPTALSDTAWDQAHLSIDIDLAALSGDAELAKTEAGALKVSERRHVWREAIAREVAAGRKWVHVTVTVGDRVNHLYGDLGLLSHINNHIVWQGNLNLPRQRGATTAIVETSILGQPLREEVELAIPRPPADWLATTRERVDRLLGEIAGGNRSLCQAVAPDLAKLRRFEEADRAYDCAIAWTRDDRRPPGLEFQRENDLRDLQAARARLARDIGDVDRYMAIAPQETLDAEVWETALQLVQEKNDCARALAWLRDGGIAQSEIDQVLKCPRPGEGVTR